MIADLAGAGIAYVPYFPLGGFTPLQSDALSEVAGELGATPMQVALAWLLQRSPNMLLIPGTSSVAHLTENLKAADIALPEAAVARLDQIGADSLSERWRNNIFASTRSDAYTVRDRPQMTIRQPMGCPVCDPDRMSAPGASRTFGSKRRFWRKVDLKMDNHPALPVLDPPLSKSVDQSHHFRLDLHR